MKTTHAAFVALATLLALAPAVAALAEEPPEEASCIVRQEPCRVGTGTEIVTCSNPPIRVPLCFI